MLRDDLHAAILEIPAIDVHSHLRRSRLQARSLDEILCYHMLTYAFYSAADSTVTSLPEDVSRRNLPLELWCERWPAFENTGFAWILKTILRDLYGFHEPVTAESLPGLRETFEAATSRESWPREVFEKGRIVRAASSQLFEEPLAEGQWDGGIRFTVETAPLGGSRQRGWDEQLERLDRSLGRAVTSRQDIDDAVAEHYDHLGGDIERYLEDTTDPERRERALQRKRFLDELDWSTKAALVAWVSAEADFTPVSDGHIERLIAAARKGEEIAVPDSRLLTGAYIRALCRAMRGRVRILQLCYGTQFVGRRRGDGHRRRRGWRHPVQKASPQLADTFGHLAGEFGDLHFNILNGYEAHEPSWCSLCQGYGNVSLACFWWQTFYPSVMHRALSRRLDMVPISKLMAFFSDGYCVDYVYGRLAMVRRVWANVLAEKVEQGFYTRDQALRIAREAFFETPRRTFMPDERIDA